jgi:hypothetical protein
MTSIVKVQGVKRIIKNLDKADRRIQKALFRGLKSAGLFLQRESQLIVPVGGWDPIISPGPGGTLKNSAFTRGDPSPIKGPDVIVGYTAKYGIYVHENENARHAPGKTAKFLEGPAKQFRVQIRNIIRNEAGRP